MYVSIMPQLSAGVAYRETRFRMPSEPERAMGLWIDRIGAGISRGPGEPRPRVLGQYAAVAVESGHGVFESPSTGRRLVTADDVVLLFPEEPHLYYGAPEWTSHWVVWNGPEAGQVAALAGMSPSAPIVRHAATAVLEAFAALQPLMPAEDFPAVLERKHLLLALLAELARRGRLGRTPPEDVLAKLIRRIGDTLAARTEVPRMAAQCHLSVAQFRRRFRQRTGRSPGAFVAALRVARAKDLLVAGVPMKAIAARTGYSDVFHFMRVFRRATGQTAGQFRMANSAFQTSVDRARRFRSP